MYSRLLVVASALVTRAMGICPDCLMRKEEQQGQSRPEEEGITPALPPPHRGGKKPVAVIWKRDPRVFLLYQESSEQSENGAS